MAILHGKVENRRSAQQTESRSAPQPVAQQEVGGFVDALVAKAGKTRLVAPIAGRLIEEATELGLEAGLTPGQIVEHVMNSLHTQALKLSAKAGKTVFPSEVRGDISELAGEAGDVGILLKDLCHVAQVDLAAAERVKYKKFISKELRVADNGTVYRVKAHIQS